ncbi:Homeodomain-like protein [Gloeopeniophorella convolvens]|nr:Homeodomain-like protein [Gloeopeniophorella convolvens]
MVRRHISKEDKHAALALSRQGLTDAEVHRRTGISVRALRRLRRTFRDTGDVVRVPAVSGRPPLVDEQHAQFLIECIEQRPGAMLAELRETLREACGVDVAVPTVWRTLQRRGYELRKATRAEIEANEAARARYRRLLAEEYAPEQLVFVDESNCARMTAERPQAWVFADGARRREFALLGGKYTVLPAVAREGILHAAVYDYAPGIEEHRAFVAALLVRMQRWPQPNSVLVADAAAAARAGPELRAMVEARGARLLVLPDWSPDLNPAEGALAFIDGWVRAERARGALGELRALLDGAFHAVTAEDVRGWFERWGGGVS